MADDAIDLGIDQLLGDDGTLLRVGLVVFGKQFELDLGAADFKALRVQFLDREARAVLVVLAEVGLRAGHRCHMAELDHDFGFRRRRCRSGGRGRCCGFRFFLLAAGAHGEGGGDGKGNYGKLGVH